MALFPELSVGKDIKELLSLSIYSAFFTWLTSPAMFLAIIAPALIATEATPIANFPAGPGELWANLDPAVIAAAIIPPLAKALANGGRDSAAILRFRSLTLIKLGLASLSSLLPVFYKLEFPANSDSGPIQ